LEKALARGIVSKLPRNVSGREAVAAFEKIGWVIRRPGNHIIMGKAGVSHHLSVPDHPDLKAGTLSRLVKDAGLTPEEFTELL
jgi:predicted RNA binding protein YcfA (HicA-like mRNA interferase family)